MFFIPLLVLFVGSTFTEFDVFVQDELISKVNVDLLIECLRSVTDAATRNLAFLLLSSSAKVSPRCISERIIDIFTVIGESAVKQVSVCF